MLAAVWTSDQDSNMEGPTEVYWTSGRAVTQADCHEFDPHIILDDLPGRIIKDLLPGIEAEAQFDTDRGTWMLRCFGYPIFMMRKVKRSSKEDWRFGRRVPAALKAFEKIDQLGVYSVAATNPTIGCRTPYGRTSRRDELSKAEDFTDVHSEKSKEG